MLSARCSSLVFRRLSSLFVARDSARASWLVARRSLLDVCFRSLDSRGGRRIIVVVIIIIMIIIIIIIIQLPAWNAFVGRIFGELWISSKIPIEILLEKTLFDDC